MTDSRPRRGTQNDTEPVTYTDPDVLTTGVREGWADPITDPREIDWAPRQAAAHIPFRVVDGRPVNPGEKTHVRYGRNELGHWGEKAAADALVFATGPDERRRILMGRRGDGHGWAIPGGCVDPGETALQAAVRELAEETGLVLPAEGWTVGEAQYVPDPRASDEAWMVTTLCTYDLGQVEEFPAVTGGDDVAEARWVRADSFAHLQAHLSRVCGSRVFPAHVGMLSNQLGTLPPTLRASTACPECGVRHVIDLTVHLTAVPPGNYSLAGAQKKLAAAERWTWECTVCGAGGRAEPMTSMMTIDSLAIGECGHRIAASHVDGAGHDLLVCPGCCKPCQDATSHR